jgi:hypothetical protein
VLLLTAFTVQIDEDGSITQESMSSHPPLRRLPLNSSAMVRRAEDGWNSRDPEKIA